MHKYSAIQSGTEGITIQLTFPWSSCPSGPNESLLIPRAANSRGPIFFQIRELALCSRESKIRDFPGNIIRNNNSTYFPLFILSLRPKYISIISQGGKYSATRGGPSFFKSGIPGNQKSKFSWDIPEKNNYK